MDLRVSTRAISGPPDLHKRLSGKMETQFSTTSSCDVSCSPLFSSVCPTLDLLLVYFKRSLILLGALFTSLVRSGCCFWPPNKTGVERGMAY
ncbi:hypothetical protein RRG08_045212 [Elysia crispata]|uniref:Uncharacterized protein n=1 Tax=Elysia crispata TaxID=231223 RepID=A0AAE1A2J2_9GAST|nr:hypothetical protein RRG08_045212 [Elysia crispata]